MCAKVISISYTFWATYNNQKTTPEQEVHKFYPISTTIFGLLGSFKNTRLKWHICLSFGWSTGRMLSASGGFAP